MLRSTIILFESYWHKVPSEHSLFLLHFISRTSSPNCCQLININGYDPSYHFTHLRIAWGRVLESPEAPSSVFYFLLEISTYSPCNLLRYPCFYLYKGMNDSFWYTITEYSYMSHLLFLFLPPSATFHVGFLFVRVLGSYTSIQDLDPSLSLQAFHCVWSLSLDFRLTLL